MIAAFLSGFKASVQNELDAFFAHLANQADLLRRASAQAFSRARQKFSATAFTRLNARLLTLVDQHLTVPRWHGLRVVAADASKMQMFLKDATRRCTQEAVAFALYLPGLEMTLAAELYSPQVGERQRLFEHLDKLAPSDLWVLDRGYPARWLATCLTQRAIAFCIRADATGFGAVKAFLRSGESERLVTLPAPTRQECQDYECERTPTPVRLVRVVTPNGRLQVLITSLQDAVAYPAADFGALYHPRWRIEEAFKRLKHRLALENTSGLSWLAAQQDFGAKILAACRTWDQTVGIRGSAAESGEAQRNPGEGRPRPATTDPVGVIAVGWRWWRYPGFRCAPSGLRAVGFEKSQSPTAC